MKSRQFNSAGGDIIAATASNNQLRRTAFIPWRLKQAIGGFNFDQVQIIVQKMPYYSQDVNVFCLKFMGSNPPPIIIGDLPCPEHCIPDHPAVAITADTFEGNHFNAVLNAAIHSPQMLIGVAVSLRGGGEILNSYTLFLHEITSIDRTPALPAYITI